MKPENQALIFVGVAVVIALLGYATGYFVGLGSGNQAATSIFEQFIDESLNESCVIAQPLVECKTELSFYDAETEQEYDPLCTSNNTYVIIPKQKLGEGVSILAGYGTRVS